MEREQTSNHQYYINNSLNYLPTGWEGIDDQLVLRTSKVIMTMCKHILIKMFIDISYQNVLSLFYAHSILRV
jgi:hypothetical protein